MSTSHAQTPITHGIENNPHLYALRLYVSFLQGLFNQLDHGTFKWLAEPDKSEIAIVTQAPINPELVGRKPVIVVLEGPYQGMGLGINNLQHYDALKGITRRTDLESSSFIVYCVADTDVIAKFLAGIVARYTRAKQRLLESPGGFYAIARPAPSVNTPSPPGALVPGDAKGSVMVQVNIPFQFQWTWETRPYQNPSNRTIEQITKHLHASDYEYTEAETVEHVSMAFSIEPVRIRKIRGGRNPLNGLLFQQQPVTVEVTEGVEDFQTSGLEEFQTENGE